MSSVDEHAKWIHPFGCGQSRAKYVRRCQLLGLLFVFVAVFVPKSVLMAAVIPPSGLMPGSKYQLIFVTASPLTAFSSEISDYDAFIALQVPGAEAFGLPAGVVWHAVASTATVEAKDNAPSGLYPVYNTVGQLVAPSNLYSGELLAPIRYDEYGIGASIHTAAVWTGSDEFGVRRPGQSLGDPSGVAMVGHAGSANDDWANGVAVWQGNTWALYALSEPITVPVPEPGTFALLGSALVALGAAHWLRKIRRTR